MMPGLFDLPGRPKLPPLMAPMGAGLPGVPMPPQQPMVMPPLDAVPEGTPVEPRPTAQPPKPRLWERISGGTRDALGALRGVLVPKAPGGYEGLLSEEEIASAKPSVLQSLLFGAMAPMAARAMQRENLDQMVERKTLGQQVQDARAEKAKSVAEKQRLVTARAEIAQRFPDPQPGASRDEVLATLRNRYAAYMAAGDMEMVKQIGEVLKSVDQQGSQPGIRYETINDSLFQFGPDGKLMNEFARPDKSGGKPSLAERRLDWSMTQSGVQNQANLSDDYRKELTVKRANEVGAQLATLETLINRESGPADIGSIVALTKLYDPGTAAREGEVKLTMDNIGPVVERLKSQLKQWKTGSRLTSQMRADIKAVIGDVRAQYERAVRPIQGDYGRKVRQLNAVNPLFAIDSATVAPSPFRVQDAAGGMPGLLQPLAAPAGQSRVNRTLGKTP